MTNLQIASVLREAAMWAHYADKCHGPRACVLMLMGRDDVPFDWREVIAEVNRLYNWHTGEWTREITVLALLFAAEAVESE